MCKFQESSFFPLGLREWTGSERPRNQRCSRKCARRARASRAQRGKLKQHHLLLLCGFWIYAKMCTFQVSCFFPLRLREWTGFETPEIKGVQGSARATRRRVARACYKHCLVMMWVLITHSFMLNFKNQYFSLRAPSMNWVCPPQKLVVFIISCYDSGSPV